MSADTPPTANIDSREIAKFEALASRWWDRESEFKPLHEINPLRANWIDRYAQVAGKTLVDVCCGGGILAEALAQRGAWCTSMDLGESLLPLAELHRLARGVDVIYLRSTAVDLAAQRPGEFDVVT